MNKYLKLSFVFITIVLWSCVTTEITERVVKELEKVSSLSAEDNEECRLYQSYQYDYW